ncbi:MAG TPA: hypothetical protein VK541_08460 [Pedobacter sp.]|uniref:hypothetical protein n=1 Tax=Pedobacter sp. TaxID=1411316 RepID=UPI002C5C6432|nr:hypothetical protein [Pedobacter sp.]HMI02498.1 hypothetical protein [Pedobacter sp.]
MGTSEIKDQLEKLGYQVITYSSPNGKVLDFIGFLFRIPLGRFKGQEIEVAINAPQFPVIPPSGPHIKPHILPITGGGGSHPFGGIHAREQPSGEFQYWSRPFSDWENTDKNMKTYLAFLRTLLDFE